MYLIHGIYQKRQSLRAAHGELRAAAAANLKCPREAHEANDAAKRMAGEITVLDEHIDRNLADIGEIEALILSMKSTGPKSAERTLAIRHLEDASMRLSREIGE